MDHPISTPPMRCRGESTVPEFVELLTKKNQKMKRTVLKKVSGLKKDQETEWFGLVLSAQMVGDTIYMETMKFVDKDTFKNVIEGHSYKFL